MSTLQELVFFRHHIMSHILIRAKQMLSQIIGQTGITFLWKYRKQILQYSGQNSSADLEYPLFKSQLRNWGVSRLSHVLSGSTVPPLCFKCILLHPSTNHPTTGHYIVWATGSVVKSTNTILTLRLLMLYIYIYIYGAPILDVSRSHTTTHHSR